MNHFASVVTASYRAQALALVTSIRRQDPTAIVHLLVVDSDKFPNPEPPPGVQWVGLHEIEDAFDPLMRYYFDAFELSNALKPFIISHLFRNGIDQVIYLDCDIMVVGRFDSVWQQLRSTSLILTPHVISPPNSAVDDSAEIGFADFGIYNGGFAAWRNTPTSLAILEWMRDRFPRLGFNAREKHMFVDQKLLPLVPMYYPDDVIIARAPGLNIAYWNSHEREVSYRDSVWSVENQPVVFFHLSGFRLNNPKVPCSYQTEAVNNRRLQRSPWLALVLSQYAQLLIQHLPADSVTGYGFNHFNRLRLTPRVRRHLFREKKLAWSNISLWLDIAIDRLKEIKRTIIAKHRAKPPVSS